MTRIKPSAAIDLGLEDDEPYQGVLVYAKFAKSKIAGYADQIEIEWELKQGRKLRDWPAIAVGQQKDGTIALLRQLLNALAEKPKDAELWFDADTLEWGYDLDGDDTTPAYAVLTPGMAVMLKGENRKDGKGVSRYRVTGYKALKAKN